MDAKELRIGNWVNHSNSAIWIDEVKNTPIQVDIDVLSNIQYYEPIPLSPEILEKCGFYFRSEPKTQSGFVKQFEKSILELFHIPHNFGSWHVIMNLSHVHSMGITVIQYVHELQNLIYLLYKTELNIKL